MRKSTIVRNIKETLSDQPITVKVVVLLTLAAIVFAAIALITGLLAGATAAVLLSAPLATRSRMQKAIKTRAKMQNLIDVINLRIDQGKNIDDQLAQLVELDKETKGISFRPLWDSYEIVTDVEKLAWSFEAHGPEGYKEFKTRLIEKGGPDYAHRTINGLPWNIHAEIFKLKI